MKEVLPCDLNSGRKYILRNTFGNQLSWFGPILFHSAFLSQTTRSLDFAQSIGRLLSTLNPIIP